MNLTTHSNRLFLQTLTPDLAACFSRTPRTVSFALSINLLHVTALLLHSPCSDRCNKSPRAPTPNLLLADASPSNGPLTDALRAESSSSAYAMAPDSPYRAEFYYQAGAAQQHGHPKAIDKDQLDANGNPIPLSRQQPKRILGLMPNYRSVSGGAVRARPTFKSNFIIATKQNFDYSSFIFNEITSLAAEGLNEHPRLGKGIGGAWAYSWRGFVDKSDGTYLQAFLLPSILHEDNRYYPMGTGSPSKRVAYASTRWLITRTYGGHQTLNLASLGGKVATQAISKSYYPAGTTPLSALAEKFAFGIDREVGFTIFREFYPDIATHALHRRKP